MQCSFYRRVAPDSPVPAVVYLHGNSGCRCDADDALHTMLPFGASVFTFDFSGDGFACVCFCFLPSVLPGSGQSEGDYVSLGVFEKEDVRAVVAHLRADPSVSTVGLWGRSMGGQSC